MPAQRKIFRIEETDPDRSGPDMPAAELWPMPQQAEIIAELKALRALIEQRPRTAPADAQQTQLGEARNLKIELDVIGEAIRQTKSEIATLQDSGFDGARVARVVEELGAVVKGAETATETILKAAEQIDEIAANLAAALRSSHELGLVQDIQDHVTQIYEACNFHDLTGQRVGKVATTMQLVEDHIARMTEIWSVIERFADVQTAQPAGDSLLNGPKLDGDAGHSTQDEIDKLFH